MKKKSPMTSSKTKSHYQTIVIGGGIVGAGIFRDLSLHGVETLLVDKKDFASQTSQSSSKMLHGGVRYLENLDFKLVWEALHEKNLWLKIAPHLARESNFYFPIFKESKRPLWMIRIGLFIYDLLSWFKNSPHRILGRKKAIAEIEGIKTEGLSGCGVYYDAIVDDAKLTLENIYDALQNSNCHALNYVGLEFFEKGDDGLYSCKFKDELTGDIKTITCKELVIACGPFTDKLLEKQSNINWAPVLLPTKGSHLWLKKDSLPVSNPMVLETKDGRIIFVIPQNKMILVGTTEEKIEGDYFNISPTKAEVDYLIECVNTYFPKSKVTLDHVLSAFAGIRPLVKEPGSNANKTAREHKIFTPEKGLHVIIGGKLTTFRVMGQAVCRSITKRFDIEFDKNKTLSSLRQKSTVTSFSNIKVDEMILKKVIMKESVRTVEDVLERRLGYPNEDHWDQRMSYDKAVQVIKQLLD